MTASIKQSEIKRAAKIAKEAGVTVEIERNGVTIRVRPDDKPLASVPEFRL